RVALMNSARFSPLAIRSRRPSTSLQKWPTTTDHPVRTTRSCRGKSRAMGVCAMASRKLLVLAAALLFCNAVASAQSTSFGLGKTPTAEEIRAWDIAISPEGKELPEGSGSAKEGATIYAQKCAACHGKNGYEGRAPQLIRFDTSGPPANLPPCL